MDSETVQKNCISLIKYGQNMYNEPSFEYTGSVQTPQKFNSCTDCNYLNLRIVYDLKSVGYLRICCSFYLYLLMITLSPAWYPGTSMQLSGILKRQRKDQVQHMKLHHFSYITQSKLQHILSISGLSDRRLEPVF